MTSREWDVVVIGAAGAQAQAMLVGAARAGDLSRWLCVDLRWPDERKAVAESTGATTVERDALSDPDRLRELVSSTRLVANFAGPYYRTGGVVLDACIDRGTDYLDICDDADATLDLLARHDAAKAAGIRALIGMGSSPGTTNVLIRAAADALGSADSVDISWVVDVADLTPAALAHFWHIFEQVDASGQRKPVSTWEELERRQVSFPEPVGTQTVVELAHSEPITVPRHLSIKTVTNFGGLIPEDSLVQAWALARLGAGTSDPLLDGVTVGDASRELFLRHVTSRRPEQYVGGGLVIDVVKDGHGIRFASGSENSMDESTGVPAAAGILLMLDGALSDPGVSAPECLRPRDFMEKLGLVSRRGGGLSTYRLRGGQQGERIRLRDLVLSEPGTFSQEDR